MNVSARRRSISDRPLRRQVREGRYEDSFAGNAETDGRSQSVEAGMGPYEVRYDISLGYGHDRPILIP
jgi:hypothetical protein